MDTGMGRKEYGISANAVKRFLCVCKKADGMIRLTYMLPTNVKDMEVLLEMAYYNPATHDIWADSNIDGFLEGCIEIDEVIAPLIRELNKRGYRTRFCCSGHPLSACNEVFTDVENAEDCFWDVQSVEKTNDSEYPYRVIITPVEDDFYISFDTKRRTDFSIPLPVGFEWNDDSTIRYRYKHRKFYPFLAERAKAAGTLHFWATQLPETE